LTQKNIGIHYQNTFCDKESGRTPLLKTLFFYKNLSLQGRLRLGCPHPAKPQAAPNPLCITTKPAGLSRREVNPCRLRQGRTVQAKYGSADPGTVNKR